MGKFTEIKDYEKALKIVVQSIDPSKFDQPITEKILEDNGWEEAKIKTKDSYINGYSPSLPMIYDEELGEWVEQDTDFEECFIYYRAAKDAWCYKFNFGTYVYDIKSIGELEIILAREGYIYSFDI